MRFLSLFPSPLSHQCHTRVLPPVLTLIYYTYQALLLHSQSTKEFLSDTSSSCNTTTTGVKTGHGVGIAQLPIHHAENCEGILSTQASAYHTLLR